MFFVFRQLSHLLKLLGMDTHWIVGHLKGPHGCEGGELACLGLCIFKTPWYASRGVGGLVTTLIPCLS